MWKCMPIECTVVRLTHFSVNHDRRDVGKRHKNIRLWNVHDRSTVSSTFDAREAWRNTKHKGSVYVLDSNLC